MNDIGNIILGQDLRIFNSNQYKAKNVLQTQLGSLDYAKNFGVDLKFFLESDLIFQTENLKAYALERLASHQIAVDDIKESIGLLDAKLDYYLREEETQEGLIL